MWIVVTAVDLFLDAPRPARMDHRGRADNQNGGGGGGGGAEAVVLAPPPKNINCAPSNNLNVHYPHFATAKEMYQHLREITQPVRRKIRLDGHAVGRVAVRESQPNAPSGDASCFPKPTFFAHTRF